MWCTSTSRLAAAPVTDPTRASTPSAMARAPSRGVRRRTTAITLLAASVVLAGCSSSPSSTASTSAHVTTAWTTFFKGSTPVAQRLALLQDASAFGAVLRAQTSSSFAKGISAKVTKVTVTSPTTATVSYSILIGGTPELSNGTGKAVLLGGKWKVSTESFCSLLQLEGGAPSICASR
jgi:hypothetical protein